MKGTIDAIGVSGRHWIGRNEKSAFDLLRETLHHATMSIRIITYSLGNRSMELDEIFDILKGKINTGVQVQLIINKFWSSTTYAQKRLTEIQHENFSLLNYDPEHENENLHAKIIIVDSKEILIGSANMSKSGLFSNHEIMVRLIGGEFASRINSLADTLVARIRGGTHYV